MRIILASGSPRRKELLEKIVSDFEVIKSNFEEDNLKKEERNPAKLVENLSKLKGEEVYSRMNVNEDFVIISSDTMVFCDEKLLGKPKDEKEAFDMIKMLQNNIHTVYTGMYVIIKKNDQVEKILTHSKTDVYFRKISDKEILDYIKEEDVLDKAGAYAIQGKAKEFVEKIEGSYNTVVGFDIEKLKEILEKYKII